jgi:hydrogenase-4 component E
MVLITIVTILVKGVLIPGMLLRAIRDAAIRREIEPFIGFLPCLLLGALGTGASLIFARTLPLAKEHVGSLLVPAAMATVWTGFLVLTTRRKAINQVVGYLVLENGIYIMGLTLLHAMPFMVEMGVLLDLFVGIFVMGIILNHIRREFSSLDTAHLSALKE